MQKAYLFSPTQTLNLFKCYTQTYLKLVDTIDEITQAGGIFPLMNL